MSQANVEMIHRVFDQAPHDPEVFYESLDDDVEWDARGAELGETIVGGDSVVARVHQWGRGRGSGATVDQSHWQVWTFRDGKVVRWTLHGDREEALAAAGLRA